MIRAAGLAVLGGLLLVSAGRAQQAAPRFDHPRHAKLFVACATCHAGAELTGQPMMPSAASCASCHNGSTEKRVEWAPRSGPRMSNLRFDHVRHATIRRTRGDTTSTCSDCHAASGASWMRVSGPQASQCVSCHVPSGAPHLSQPDSACASCHVPLPDASLPASRIAGFPAPASHRSSNFMTRAGHGRDAERPGRQRVAASCAVCHARDYCTSCHVDALEVGAIKALGADPRSLAIRHELIAPPSHRAPGFESAHGKLATQRNASCQTCHTQESCLNCHRAAAPGPVLALFKAGPGRGPGAATVRQAPSSHSPSWRSRHGPFASASIRNCASCHAREECLSCHLPASANRNGYHPPGYLTRHPADGYSRSSACADCHNTGEFCQTCHNQAGLTSRRTLLGAAGYHDGNRQFLFGHGQAARQGLESCVSCHIERDCLTCHSSVKGRGFSPHGPGFNPEQMLRKNPQLCTACHGTAIPRSATRQP